MIDLPLASSRAHGVDPKTDYSIGIGTGRSGMDLVFDKKVVADNEHLFILSTQTRCMDMLYSLQRVEVPHRVLMTVRAVPEVEPRGIVNACAVVSQRDLLADCSGPPLGQDALAPGQGGSGRAFEGEEKHV